ncbi:DUF6520 family protein [Sinomicrobium sp. M5D2P17]
MKKLKFAIAAMVIAVGVIGAFAFGNANEKEPVKEEMQTFWYGNNGDGTYRLLEGAPDPNNCLQSDNLPCTISSEQEIDEGFDYDDKPADAVESTNTNVYVGS